MNGSLTIQGYDIVILKGTSKEKGKPYCFAKLDRRLANNASFLKLAEEAGAAIIQDGVIQR